MASDYRIISGGTTIYLNNSNGVPTSGGAATAVGTTPWMLRSPEWTLHASVPETLFTGGPPFRNGSSPVSAASPVVTETIPLILNGGNHDTLVARLQQLRQLANTALTFAPAVLYAQPSGATSPVYFEILAASAQERAADSGESPGEGATLIHVDLTITRSVHGGAASLANLFTNSTFTNNGSGNLTSLGALTGDLVNEGQPLNLKIDGPAASTTNVDTLWIAAAHSRVKTTHTTTVGTTTTSTFAHSTTAINATPLLTNAGVNLAVFVRFSSVTAGNKALFALQLALHDSGKNVAPITPWMPMPVTSGTTMMLAGVFPLSGQRIPIASALSLDVYFWVKSIDGTSVGYTVDYSESVFAYTVAVIPKNGLSAHTYGNGGDLLYITEAQNLNGSAWLPLTPPSVYVAALAGVNPSFVLAARGQLPLAFSGASLWAAWIGASGSHTTTDTLRITANHAPLYQSLRGAG